LAAAASCSQSIDTEVSRRTVQPTADVAVDLQRRLVVQAPKSIVGYLFRRRAIAEQSHQNGDDPSIVLKKDDPEISLIPMLR
jgi:hypothetical protein